MADETKEFPKMELIRVFTDRSETYRLTLLSLYSVQQGHTCKGDSSDGKSTFILTIVTLLTRGEPLPFTEQEITLILMCVIYQTVKDGCG